MANILFIAPNAPPKNTAEAIQVRRILSDLDAKATGTLVTVLADDTGWSRRDTTLDLPLQNFTTQTLRLPLHRFTNRLLASRHFKRFLTPDNYVWITLMAGSIARNLRQKADVIYSRSSPMSAALLARRLKRELGVPWIMHLSDPWADNPYFTAYPRHYRTEADCFADADRITLTTDIQANFYRQKYPLYAAKIGVSPNVMPEIPPPVGGRLGGGQSDATSSPNNGPSLALPLSGRGRQPNDQCFEHDTQQDAALHLIFAGSFYGDRSPKPLIDALKLLHPELHKKLRIDIYGNAEEEARALLSSMPGVIHYHGAVSFAEAQEAQEQSDIVLSIEPEISHPLGSSFLPSKVLDCLALGKPLLAITPADSETAAICREGYGWTVPPSRPDLIAELLKNRIEALSELRQMPLKPAPSRYAVSTIVDDLLKQIQELS